MRRQVWYGLIAFYLDVFICQNIRRLYGFAVSDLQQTDPSSCALTLSGIVEQGQGPQGTPAVRPDAFRSLGPSRKGAIGLIPYSTSNFCTAHTNLPPN